MRIFRFKIFIIVCLAAFSVGIFSLFAVDASDVTQLTNEVAGTDKAWWILPLTLFVFTFILGIVAIAAGIGGGVLFVPIVSGFFPIGIDFVRGAGLMVALAGALSASPALLKKGLANLRLAIPMALIASASSIVGAKIGLQLPAHLVQIFLGIIIVGIVFILLLAKKSEFPHVAKEDSLGKKLGIGGTYLEESTGKNVAWKVHRVIPAMFLFVIIGFLAGMFGLGAGWANVPVLNLVLGAPLKIAVGTSIFILSLTDTTAAWVYLNNSAIIPLIVVPSMAGMMIGTRIGVKVLEKTKPGLIKWGVIILLGLTGIRSLLKGLGVW
ncbi:MAG: sulfite exporter TauE/SafE family protein [Leptospirales bacterium]